jgi:CzcA family heavy metal efflux pump
MFKRIVGFSIKFRKLILFISVLFIIYSVFLLPKLKYDIFPNFVKPSITIQTLANGFSPQQVELLVTQPIEDVLHGINGVQVIRSKSIQGLSIVKVFFKSNSNIYLDRQLVSDQLTIVENSLPKQVQPPVLSPLTSTAGVVLTMGLTSQRLSLTKLRTFAEWVLKPRLLAIRGVANVAIFGGKIRQIQIQLNNNKLLKYNLSMNEIANQLSNSLKIMGLGFVDSTNQRINFQYQAPIQHAHQLLKLLIFKKLISGSPLLIPLRKFSKIKYSFAPRLSAGLVNTHRSVIIQVFSQYKTNTLTVSGRISRTLKSMQSTLQKTGIQLHANLFKPADFINIALKNMIHSIIIGGLLVIIILVLFLYNFKAAVISCVAIPLSLLSAVVFLHYVGLTINIMTLGGLVVALGEVVDDAVIDVENIIKRISENSRLNISEPFWKVVINASLEIRGAVIYATLAVLAIFIPVLTMTGLAGRLFRPLALTYLFAVFASLLVALLITPALCVLLFKNYKNTSPGSPIADWLKKRYYQVLKWTQEHYAFVLISCLLLIGSLILVIPHLKTSFLPHSDDPNQILHVAMVPGTSLQESTRVGKIIEKMLLKIPGVKDVGERIGRTTGAVDIFGTNQAEIDLRLVPSAGNNVRHIKKVIIKKMQKIKGVVYSINGFLTERINETLSAGSGAPVIIQLFGQHLKLLDRKILRLAQIVKNTRGASQVEFQSVPRTPEIEIQLNLNALSHWGFQPQQVLDQIHIALEGKVIGQVYSGNRTTQVIVILNPKDRETPQQIGKISVKSLLGYYYVPLAKLAKINFKNGRFAIYHQNGRRMESLSCYVKNRSINSFEKSLRERIKKNLHLNSSMYIKFLGTAAAQNKAKTELIVHSIFIGLIVLLILGIVLRHPQNLLLIIVNLPMTLIGGFWASLFLGGWITVGSMVGFITLFGITVRNSILMITHYQNLVLNEKKVWCKEIAIQGAVDRLIPILMTACITSAGLLPLALSPYAPGHEIEGPMALIILGGLITSTLLNLLVLPSLAWRYGKFDIVSHEIE